jgi:hypothetical protein
MVIPMDALPFGVRHIAIFMTEYRARRARSTMDALRFGVRRLDGALFDFDGGDE